MSPSATEGAPDGPFPLSDTNMHDLRWTVPVACWSAIPAAKVDLGFVEPLVRRRLSSLSKIALKVAQDCAAAHKAVRVVFASRHGELGRTTEILRAIDSGEAVSPTAFSLSVLNAMTGVFGILRGDRSPASAISAGAETLGFALLEAHAQFEEDPASPVLLVYADEPADAVYGAIDNEIKGSALAILLDNSAAAGRLSCVFSQADASPSDTGTFPTQSEAVLHCLEAQTTAAWPCAGPAGTAHHWQWSWHAGAA